MCFPSNLSNVAVKPKINLYLIVSNTYEKVSAGTRWISSNINKSHLCWVLDAVFIINTSVFKLNPCESKILIHCSFNGSVGTTTIALSVGYLVKTFLKQSIATLVFPNSFVIVRVIILTSINFFIAQRTFSSVLDVGHSWTYYILLQFCIKSSIKEILNLSNISIVCLEYSFLKYLVIVSCFSFSKRSPNTTKLPLGSLSNFILCIIVSMSTRYGD